MAIIRARTAGVLLAPAPALTIGVLVMRGGELPPATWLLNVAAAIGGILVTWGALAWGRTTPTAVSPRWALVVGVAVLATTLAGPGVEGVHRWMPGGPIRLHAGALVLPSMLVALERAPWVTSAIAACTMLVLVSLQPDAAQAVSFAAGWAIVVGFRREKGAGPVILVSVLVGLAGLLGPDPLGPVAHVEGIVGMAAAQGPLLAGAALLSLVLLPISLATFLPRPVGGALALYTTGTLIAAWLGHHPVPILGYGVSPILGYYGAVALDAVLHQPVRQSPGERTAAT